MKEPSHLEVFELALRMIKEREEQYSCLAIETAWTRLANVGYDALGADHPCVKRYITLVTPEDAKPRYMRTSIDPIQRRMDWLLEEMTWDLGNIEGVDGSSCHERRIQVLEKAIKLEREANDLPPR